MISDLAPEEIVWIVAAVEGGGLSRSERLGIQHAAAILLAKPRIFGEEPEADEKVGLPAAHRLLQVKDGLRRDAGETSSSLADEVLHSLSDVSLFKKLCAVSFRIDQLIELFNLIAQLDREGVQLKFTSIANRFHLNLILVGLLIRHTSWLPGLRENLQVNG